MSNFYVYSHYALDTDELFYIGKGCGNRASDKRQRNNYWNSIVKKHDFRYEILINNLLEPDSLIQEILAIMEFKPKANFSKGGVGDYTGLNSGNFKKGCIPWNKGKKCPQLSERQKGSKNHMFGKKSVRIKKVKCINDGKFFDSVKDCYNYYKISSTGMFNALRDGNITKGYRFQYV